MRFFLIIFILTPIVEMVVLIKVGGIIGALPTVGLVLLTAMIGLALLRRQGLAALRRAQEKVQSGAIPVHEMVEGIFLAVGGALLLTPGFVTDAIGFCCLLPGVRQLIIARGLKLWKPHIVVFGDSLGPNYSSVQGKSAGQSTHDTIEGQFKRED